MCSGLAVPPVSVPLLLLLVLASFSVSRGAGLTRYVDDNTCPGTGSGTLADPFCRIQDAICAAASGDTVSVAPGTYPEAIRMKPGVSLVSEVGPALTTINTAAQPCTDNDFCTKRPGSQCTVVTFPSGHSPSTVLDGFTITGGAGLIQTTIVAGGGIFVFSSPTIINNVIVANVLSGPSPQGNKLFGAGIYVGVGQPIISGNVVMDNVAIPPAGGGPGAVTSGQGGGIYVGSGSSPEITGNVIQANTAGDRLLVSSNGLGGGLLIFPGGSGPLIDRNVIADNVADGAGGGVCLLFSNSSALAQVTNNVIVGNSAFRGGGVYTYFNRSNTINNTIIGNEAFLGGGVYSGNSDASFPVSITNNIIESNTLENFGGGGGIYTIDLYPDFDPSIEANDLFNNEFNQVDGDQSDATIIGVNGNFSADPLFVNSVARDYHLDPNSPAIDTAFATQAPPVDHDSNTRGFDGDGVPDSPQVGDVDVGAFEFQPACVPQPEVCDGVDNNCNSLIDEGFPDTDADTLVDCVDPDDDNDGVLDGADCAPLDASAFAMPGEVTGVAVTQNSPTEVTFDTQNVGSGTLYEVVSGLTGRIVATQSLMEDFCLAPGVATGSLQDTRPGPPANDAWFYLIRAGNSCGTGSLGGGAARAEPRAAEVCQTGIVDADADGSPSDLDCNDADPTISPIAVELCDGLDNNCNGTVDENTPDVDRDGFCNQRDNCPQISNPGQRDLDADGEGDLCDANDGVIFFVPGGGTTAGSVAWQNEPFEAFNLYRGQISWLRSTGVLTQFPDNPQAARFCGLTSPELDDGFTPPLGDPAFYLVTGVNGGVEVAGLGNDSSGSARQNTNPCP